MRSRTSNSAGNRVQFVSEDVRFVGCDKRTAPLTPDRSVTATYNVHDNVHNAFVSLATHFHAPWKSQKWPLQRYFRWLTDTAHPMHPWMGDSEHLPFEGQTGVTKKHHLDLGRYIPRNPRKIYCLYWKKKEFLRHASQGKTAPRMDFWLRH